MKKKHVEQISKLCASSLGAINPRVLKIVKSYDGRDCAVVQCGDEFRVVSFGDECEWVAWIGSAFGSRSDAIMAASSPAAVHRVFVDLNRARSSNKQEPYALNGFRRLVSDEGDSAHLMLIKSGGYLDTTPLS